MFHWLILFTSLAALTASSFAEDEAFPVGFESRGFGQTRKGREKVFVTESGTYNLIFRDQTSGWKLPILHTENDALALDPIPIDEFVSVMSHRRLIHPDVLVNLGDGTWSLAVNGGLWAYRSATGSVLNQKVAYYDLEDLPVDKTGIPAGIGIAKLIIRDLPLKEINQQIKLSAIGDFGKLPERASKQRFFLTTEYRGALPVVVLGYQTCDLALTVKEKKNGFVLDWQMAYVVPRSFLEDADRTRISIYLIPAYLLHLAYGKSRPLRLNSDGIETWLSRYWIKAFSLKVPKRTRGAKLVDKRARKLIERTEFEYGELKRKFKQTSVISCAEEIAHNHLKKPQF